jgi:5-methylcytosine-specific restriction enzyme A
MGPSINNTFLFTWNPVKFDWGDINANIEEIEKSGYTMLHWANISYRNVKPGDRAFLMRLGEEPKGIIGSGVIKDGAIPGRHWSGDNKVRYYAKIKFDTILHPDMEPLLSLKFLRSGKLGKFNWTPQASGIEIPAAYVDELETAWFNFLGSQYSLNNPGQPGGETVFTEGSPNKILITRYERNPIARKICIEHHGLSCAVCDFNFGKVYGKIGQHFIHVHHLFQIAKIRKKYTIDPIKDLRPVCPNCHVMIHQKKIPFTIEEMKEKLKRGTK